MHNDDGYPTTESKRLKSFQVFQKLYHMENCYVQEIQLFPMALEPTTPSNWVSKR